MKISFLLNNAFGVGGTVSAVMTLAGALARMRGVEVEVVSVFRRTSTPAGRVPRGVRLGYLLDMRRREVSHSALLSGVSELVPPEEEYYRQYSRVSDAAIADYAARSDVDIVVATRPSLAIALASLGCRSDLVIQMHHVADSVPAGVHEALRKAASRASVVHAVTSNQTEAWRSSLPESIRVLHVPNAVRQSPLPMADPRSKLVLAVGRLDPIKRYDMLIEVFAGLPDEFDDWRLRIVGGGGEHDRLQGLVDTLGAGARVELGGRNAHVFEEMASGSVLISTSAFESFGLTLVEAMSAGLAVISSDCPIGPREIVRDGVDGMLFASGDADSLRSTAISVLSQELLRASLGAKGTERAALFAPSEVARRFLQSVPG